jgi:hypothetical protein
MGIMPGGGRKDLDDMPTDGPELFNWSRERLAGFIFSVSSALAIPAKEQ